ncbi:MAG TPA: hypothetical protein PL033_14410 [Candidatus Brocadiia bacterium]|nr:hypothetical protein [Candidatus Brocadiia bacterium]
MRNHYIRAAGMMFSIALVLPAGCATSDRDGLHIEWRYGPQLKESRGSHSVAAVNGIIWAAGGTNWVSGNKLWLDSVEILDVESAEWLPGPQMPRRRAGGHAFPTSDGFAIFGGCEGDAALASGVELAFRHGKAVWTQTVNLPSPRVYGSATCVSGKYFIAGGTSDPAGLSPSPDSFITYDPGMTEKGWTALEPMPQPCVNACAVGIAEKVYIFGGCVPDKDKGVINLDRAACYDPASMKWEAIAPAPFPCRGWTAIAWRNRYAILMGGYAGLGAGDGFTNRVIVFDTVTRSYRDSAPMPMANFTESVLAGKTIYLIGGEDAKKHRTPTTMIGEIRD